jgi:signal transduction histidine kinase
MSDRIQNIGGTLETISQAGQGTLLKISWTAPSD